MSDFLIKMFVKDKENYNNPRVRESYGRLSGFAGIVCNLFLCLLKIIIGSLSSSISIIADGLNNLSDMGSSLITMIGFKMAGKPADSEHPFGHGRMEYMSAFIVAVLILLVGIELFKSSLLSLIRGDKTPVYSLISAIILLVSIVIKLWMYFFNKKLGKIINSNAMFATAQDSLNDIIATTVILISVGISVVTTLPFNLDAAMGIIVAIFIIFSGISTARDTLNQILGGPPDPELISNIQTTVLSFKEFIGIHDLIVHNYGPGRQFASVHVEVPQDINIVKCHEQIDLCEKTVYEKLNISLVIHMDPIDVNNIVVKETKEKILSAIKIIDKNLTLHDFRMTPSGDKRTNLIFDVLLPSTFKMSTKDLNEKISELAKLINPTFVCVITFDQDYTIKK